MPIDRRTFIKGTAATGTILAAPFISKLGAKESANNRINVAYIGVGGWGKKAALGDYSENVVAYCDVDESYAADTYAKRPDVPRFRDFRKMFDQLGSGIDAVSIATPDHTHFPLAMEAMRRGYHLYLEKPLAHSILEMRQLKQASAKYGIISQLGIQGHSFEGLRVLKEWIDSGIIGEIVDVHYYTDRPKARDWHSYEEDAPGQAVPSTLDWDLWLGPARWRPYNSVYQPLSWRGWWDFGNGPLGDIGAHVWDVIEYCLEIGLPDMVTAESPRASEVGTGRWIKVDYHFAGNDERMPLGVHWYSGMRDGKPHLPRQIPYIPQQVIDEREHGFCFIGQKGAFFIPGFRAESAPQVFPEALREELRVIRPPRILPRIKGTHRKEFFNAIREGRKANADFSYGAPLNESVLIGNLAIRTGKTIHWDAEAMCARGLPEADRYIYPPEPRKGWNYLL